MAMTNPAPDKDALDKAAFGYTVADITRLFRRVFDRRAAHLGLTRAQWRALSRIERAEGLTQAQLAEDLDLEQIAIGRVIDRLVQAGFVERRGDPDDRRCWRLHLAPKSSEVMAKMKRIAATLRDDVLAEVGSEEFTRAMRVLATVKNTLAELDREVRPRAPARKKSKP
jgi:DNA-binding MarR family transcriptional regulator